MTTCPCGCGDPVPKGRTYAHPDRCKQRAYRKRVKAAAEAKGLPASLSLKTLEGSTTTTTGNGDRERNGGAGKRRIRRPRPGVSVYFPSLALAESVLVVLRDQAEDDAVEPVERAVARRREKKVRSG